VIRTLLVSLLVSLSATGLWAEDVAFLDAVIVDGLGGEPYVGTLLVSGDRIEAVGREVSVPSSYRVIDARGKTLTPGLMDLHTHLTYSAVSGLAGDWPKNLAAYLYSGVTTAVEFGAYPEQFEPMRKLLAEGTVRGPRIHFAVRIAPPYGHGMEGGRGDYFSRELFSAEGAERVVRALEEFRPDALKLFTDGWRYGYAEPMASMPEDVIAAAVEAAHRRGWEVLTHTVTVEGAMDAAGGGVDVLDHGISDGEAPRELIDLILEKGVTYAPTHAVYHPKGRDILDEMLAAVVPPDSRARVKPPLAPPTEQTKLVRGYRDPASPRALRWKNLVANTAKLHRAGVAIGAGTDAGVTNTWHGWSTLRELRLMVHAGMTPLEALTAATGTSARALNVEDERGTLAKGKLADLVLFDGRPDREIADVLKIARVFQGGEEVDREALRALMAEAGMTKLPATVPAALLDDFEASGRRSSLGTNWVNSTDSGLDHATARFTRIWRAPGDRAMSVQAEMSLEDSSWSSVELPLTPGSVTPADLSGYESVEFDVRGDGAYRLEIERMRDRNYRAENPYPFRTFRAGAEWRTVRIPLAELETDSDGFEDAVLLRFRFDGAPGERLWLELDDLKLVR